MNDKIKTICLFIFFSLVLSNPGASMEEHKDLPQEIFKHWVHSHEDDTKDIKVFRPVDYKFPPSRGRGLIFASHLFCYLFSRFRLQIISNNDNICS